MRDKYRPHRDGEAELHGFEWRSLWKQNKPHSIPSQLSRNSFPVMSEFGTNRIALIPSRAQQSKPRMISNEREREREDI